jgi:hypothetical protein
MLGVFLGASMTVAFVFLATAQGCQSLVEWLFKPCCALVRR